MYYIIGLLLECQDHVLLLGSSHRAHQHHGGWPREEPLGGGEELPEPALHAGLAARLRLFVAPGKAARPRFLFRKR